MNNLYLGNAPIKLNATTYARLHWRSTEFDKMLQFSVNVLRILHIYRLRYRILSSQISNCMVDVNGVGCWLVVMCNVHIWAITDKRWNSQFKSQLMSIPCKGHSRHNDCGSLNNLAVRQFSPDSSNFQKWRDEVLFVYRTSAIYRRIVRRNKHTLDVCHLPLLHAVIDTAIKDRLRHLNTKCIEMW